MSKKDDHTFLRIFVTSSLLFIGVFLSIQAHYIWHSASNTQGATPSVMIGLAIAVAVVSFLILMFATASMLGVIKGKYWK